MGKEVKGITEEQLAIVIQTESRRNEIKAAVIKANAVATGDNPEKALLEFGSVTIYKASRD